MLLDCELMIGDHCWALMNNKLVMVVKMETEGYDVCGPWECGVGIDDLTLLEKVPRPEGHHTTELYYNPKDLETDY